MRAGSEINQLLIGEALSDEFDGKILNPHGIEIDLSFVSSAARKKGADRLDKQNSQQIR